MFSTFVHNREVTIVCPKWSRVSAELSCKDGILSAGQERALRAVCDVELYCTAGDKRGSQSVLRPRKTYWRPEVGSHTLLALPLDGDDWSASRPGRRIAGELIRFIQWMNPPPSVDLEIFQKKKILTLPELAPRSLVHPARRLVAKLTAIQNVFHTLPGPKSV